MTKVHPVLRILSLGAGVQSSTLVYMMVDGLIPKADHAIFADTGWEPAAVYQHLNYLTDVLEKNGIQFHKVSSGNILEDSLGNHGRFAAMPLYVRDKNGKKGIIRRQCTGEYKVKPLVRKQRELVGLQPRQRSKLILATTIIGISWDESQRVREPEFPWLVNDYPLIDRRLTRSDCVNYAKSHDWPIPPRSACIGCPFKSNKEWRRLRDESPNEWQQAVDFDRRLRDKARPTRMTSLLQGEPFLHASLMPLDEVDLRTESERGVLNLFEQECFGMCGV